MRLVSKVKGLPESSDTLTKLSVRIKSALYYLATTSVHVSPFALEKPTITLSASRP